MKDFIMKEQKDEWRAYMRLLAELAADLSVPKFSPEILEDVARLLVKSTGSDTGYVAVVDVEKTKLTVLSFFGNTAEYQASAIDLELDAGSSLPAYCIMTGRTIIVPDAVESPFGMLAPTIRSAMCAPIILSGEAIGAIALFSDKGGYYSASDAEFLQDAAAQIARYCRVHHRHIFPTSSRKAILKSKKRFAFVLMPFHEPFNKYYHSIIRPAILEAGIESIRADEIYRPSEIITDIYDYIKSSTVLIAELTGRNPNVLYELGYGHAIGKTAIMITQSIDDMPFDLRGFRCIVYDTTDPDWAKTLKTKIAEFIRSVCAQHPTA